MSVLPHRAVFLDRDGTINVEKNYLYRIEDFEFIGGAIEAIRLLNENDFRVVVVSNQAGIARGFYTPNDVHVLHDSIQRELRKHEAHVDAFFYCPHHPDGSIDEFRKVCDCRKPNTGMILQANEKLNLDLPSSYVVGDLWTDIKLGENAGLKTILVRTGHGEETLRDREKHQLKIDRIAENVLDAVKMIIKFSNGKT